MPVNVLNDDELARLEVVATANFAPSYQVRHRVLLLLPLDAALWMVPAERRAASGLAPLDPGVTSAAEYLTQRPSRTCGTDPVRVCSRTQLVGTASL